MFIQKDAKGYIVSKNYFREEAKYFKGRCFSDAGVMVVLVNLVLR